MLIVSKQMAINHAPKSNVVKLYTFSIFANQQFRYKFFLRLDYCNFAFKKRTKSRNEGSKEQILK